MSFGGYAPLPLRLGGEPETGWRAVEHARLVADLAACALGSAFAVFTFVKSGATVTVESYIGQNGVGLAYAPTPTVLGTGSLYFSWDRVYEDEYERVVPVDLNYAEATVVGSANVLATCDARVHEVDIITRTADTGAAVDARVTVVVGPGLTTDAKIGTYDGATDKRDSDTEGDVPYAWTWYQEYESMMGSAFTKERSGLVHSKKLALARREAAITRLAEKYQANTRPNTADESLGDWIRLLGVRLRGNETRQEIRQRCANRLLASRGPTWTRIDEACEGLLGDAFVRTWRRYGTALSSPPTITYWPGVNPGLAAYSLGGGAWFSERCHLVVEVEPPASLSEGEFLHLVNVELFRMLDELLPAHATFDWATGITDGFLLDVSDLDYGGLTD